MSKYVKKYIQENLEDFLGIYRKYHVKLIYAFGSAVNNKFNEIDSDIDLLLEIDGEDPLERGDNLLKIWDELEDFFKRKVDLMTMNSISNPFFRKSVESIKVLIYDREKEKVYL